MPQHWVRQGTMQLTLQTLLLQFMHEPPTSLQGGYRSTGCDEAVAMRGGEVSVGNSLRLALAAILKSRSDTRCGPAGIV